LRPTSHIQRGEQFAQALGVDGLNACHAARLEVDLKSLMPECENHKPLSLDLQNWDL
jgi:hypothetical protein